MGPEWDALRALGAAAALCLLLRAAWGAGCAVYVHLLPPVRRGAPWLRAHGAWAVVTGATGGIGRAYAHEVRLGWEFGGEAGRGCSRCGFTCGQGLLLD
ncbi:very-long-chain 3-oxoacyl-CoA reductase-like [Pipistrellus kuhlii]|uniref:very-long-chain 3-oxoacyl-CoA reductase-like n=1 Tax=Pipistrellus kuhlii TaxID=59472 RepID=UPI001E272798|nr:very-long-chain 3-oxoacyl-CoA reductase-like [Pipistrellus kuhlii]